MLSTSRMRCNVRTAQTFYNGRKRQVGCREGCTCSQQHCFAVKAATDDPGWGAGRSVESAGCGRGRGAACPQALAAAVLVRMQPPGSAASHARLRRAHDGLPRRHGRARVRPALPPGARMTHALHGCRPLPPPGDDGRSSAPRWAYSRSDSVRVLAHAAGRHGAEAIRFSKFRATPMMDMTATRFGPLGRAEHIESVGERPASCSEGAPCCTLPAPPGHLSRHEVRGRKVRGAGAGGGGGGLQEACRAGAGAAGGAPVPAWRAWRPPTVAGALIAQDLVRSPVQSPSAARKTPPHPGSLSCSCMRRTTHGKHKSHLHEHQPRPHEQPRFQAWVVLRRTACRI